MWAIFEIHLPVLQAVYVSRKWKDISPTLSPASNIVRLSVISYSNILLSYKKVYLWHFSPRTSQKRRGAGDLRLVSSIVKMGSLLSPGMISFLCFSNYTIVVYLVCNSLAKEFHEQDAFYCTEHFVWDFVPLTLLGPSWIISLWRVQSLECDTISHNLFFDEVRALLDEYLSKIRQTLRYSIIRIISAYHHIVSVHRSVWGFDVIVGPKMAVRRPEELVETSVEGQVVRSVT